MEKQKTLRALVNCLNVIKDISATMCVTDDNISGGVRYVTDNLSYIINELNAEFYDTCSNTVENVNKYVKEKCISLSNEIKEEIHGKLSTFNDSSIEKYKDTNAINVKLLKFAIYKLATVSSIDIEENTTTHVVNVVFTYDKKGVKILKEIQKLCEYLVKAKFFHFEQNITRLLSNEKEYLKIREKHLCRIISDLEWFSNLEIKENGAGYNTISLRLML